MTEETAPNLELVAATPSSALGSTRDKPDRKYCLEILRVVQAHGIDCFFYIGGNDSADTVRIISEAADGPPAIRSAASIFPRPSTTT